MRTGWNSWRFVSLLLLVTFLWGDICSGTELDCFRLPFGIAASPNPDRAFGQDIDKAFKRIEELGVGWVRVHHSWADLEPEPGRFDEGEWQRHVAIIDGLRARGLNPAVFLGGIPHWAVQDVVDEVRKGEHRRRKGRNLEGKRGREKKVSAKVPRLEELQRIVSRLVGLYRGKVRYYQFLNETNAGPHWIEPEEFARLMKVAYEAAKQADPNCLVIMGGLAAGGKIPKTVYLERFIAAGGTTYTDVIDLHMYNYISRFFTDIPAVRKVLDKHGIQKPIWVLETGDPSQFDSVMAIAKAKQHFRSLGYEERGPWDWPSRFDEAIQARRLVQRLVLGLSQGVERIFWYADMDRLSPEEVGPWEKASGHKNTKGLLYPDFTPKKSYMAYQHLIRQLGTARFKRVLSAPNSQVPAFLFQWDGRILTVLWRWQGTGRIRMSGLDGSYYEVLDIYGQQLQEGTVREAISLDLGEEPIYLVTAGEPVMTVER